MSCSTRICDIIRCPQSPQPHLPHNPPLKPWTQHKQRSQLGMTKQTEYHPSTPLEVNFGWILISFIIFIYIILPFIGCYGFINTLIYIFLVHFFLLKLQIMTTKQLIITVKWQRNTSVPVSQSYCENLTPW